MLNIILGLVGALGLSGLGLLFYKNKDSILEAINNNSKVITQVTDLSKQQLQNEGGLQVEEQKREDLNAEIEQNKNELDSQAQLLQFFNKKDNK